MEHYSFIHLPLVTYIFSGRYCNQSWNQDSTPGTEEIQTPGLQVAGLQNYATSSGRQLGSRKTYLRSYNISGFKAFYKSTFTGLCYVQNSFKKTAVFIKMKKRFFKCLKIINDFTTIICEKIIKLI